MADDKIADASATRRRHAAGGRSRLPAASGRPGGAPRGKNLEVRHAAEVLADMAATVPPIGEDRRDNRCARIFPQAAQAALRDARLQTAAGHLKDGFQLKRAAAFAASPVPFEEIARAGTRHPRLRRCRASTNCWCSSKTGVMRAGGQVHWARDAAKPRAKSSPHPESRATPGPSPRASPW